MSRRFVRVHRLTVDEEPGARFRLEREEDKRIIDLVDEVVWPEQVDNPNSNHIRETHEALVAVRVQARGKHVGRQHISCSVMGINDPLPSTGMLHRIRWYPRGRGRR